MRISTWRRNLKNCAITFFIIITLLLEIYRSTDTSLYLSNYNKQFHNTNCMYIANIIYLLYFKKTKFFVILDLYILRTDSIQRKDTRQYTRGVRTHSFNHYMDQRHFVPKRSTCLYTVIL